MDALSDASSTLSTDAGQAKAKAIKKRVRKENDEADLLEQRRSVQDAVFTFMYILRRNRGGGSYKDGPQRTAAVLVLEALLTLLVIFNPLFTWDFATSSGGSLLYKIVRWPLLRVGLVEQPYKTYVGVFYTLVGLVAATYVAAAWLAILLHRNDSSKLLRKLAGYLSWAAEWGFGVAYLMLIDYMAHLYVCDFYGGSGSTGMSLVWPAVDCLAMPHVVHMSVAAVFIVLTTALALMVVITNCDLNPVCRHWLGSPCAGTKAQVVLLKVATALLAHLVPASMPILQATLMMLAQAYVLWIHVTQIPYYHKWVNAAYCGLQAAVVYAAALLLALAKLPADRSTFVTLVLAYGVAPAVLTGGGLSLAWQAAFAWRLARFRGVDPKSKLKLVYRFHRLQDVELLARCCRCYDGDGLVRPDAAALAELVVKVAKARSPSSAYLLVLQANYQLNVLHDGPAARTQLQLALKNSPSMLLRFQIYATTEISKLTKDGAEGSLDLVAYVEFKRNLRTVLRVHRDVLQQQRDFWRSLLSDTAKAKAIRDGLADIERAVDRATQVYRRVRERYPTNPKLLTCYGRFLEDVRNDPWAANRLYVEASRYSDNDAMNVDLALNPDAPAFLQSMDMNEDAVIIINGEGVIMMVNNQGCAMFGYSRNELEGSNISTLMPQPFSQRHNKYLGRYLATGVPHILDSIREVVGLHKDRYVFPIHLCVTKLSGTGSEVVFLGVLRPAPIDPANVRVWIAPNGLVLCTDTHYSNICGEISQALVGRQWAELGVEEDKMQALVDAAQGASLQDFETGAISVTTLLKHRYLPPVLARITVRLGGTEQERLFVMNINRLDDDSSMLLVTDHHGRVKFTTWEFAAMLGHSWKKITAMKLDQLLPPPLDAFHSQWVRDMHPTRHPSASCRAGVLVNVLSAAGVPIPVTLSVSTKEDADGTFSVVKLNKVAPADVPDHKRVSLRCDFHGNVDTVLNGGGSARLFGFSADALVGCNLVAFVEELAEWAAAQQQQQPGGGADLMSALMTMLDREAESPGLTWRVGVHVPGGAGGRHQRAGSASEGDGFASLRRRGDLAPKSAYLQVEMMEADDGSAAVKLTLWRADILGGHLEIDEALNILKADAAAGLIFGAAPQSLPRRNLVDLFALPPHSTWSGLTRGSGPKASLKAGSGRGAKASPPLVLVGPRHPDGGALAVRLQGVTSARRIMVVAHPEGLGAAGHRANLATFLREAEEAEAARGSGMAAAMDGAAGGGGSDDDEDNGMGTDDDNSADDEYDDPRFGRIKTSRSEKSKVTKSRIESWVEEAAPHIIGEAHIDDDGDQFDVEGGGSAPRRYDGGTGGGTRRGGGVNPNYYYDGDEGADIGSSGGGSYGDFRIGAKSAQSPQQQRGGSASRRPHGPLSAPPAPDDARSDTSSDAGGGGGRGGGGGDGASVDGSEGDGSSVSGASSVHTGGPDVQSDARRMRLLRKLDKVFSAPALTAAQHRHWRLSWWLLAAALVAHIAGFVVISSLVKGQIDNVARMTSLGRGMDASQVVLADMYVYVYCMDPGVTAVSMCTEPLADRRAKVFEDILEFEEDHYTAYVGQDTSRVQQMKDRSLFDLWTNGYADGYDNTAVLDVSSGEVQVVSRDGVWQLGTKYLAHLREFDWAADNLDHTQIPSTRWYRYLQENGDSVVYAAYRDSIDVQTEFIEKDIRTLVIGLALVLVFEAILLQGFVIAWLTKLVARVESVRHHVMLVLLGLPTPILRALANRPLHVIDDEDDDSDAGSEAGDAPPATGGKGGDASGGGGSGGGASFTVRAKKSSSRRRKRNRGVLGRFLRPDPDAVAGEPRNAIHFNGKHLHQSPAAMLRFSGPLALWYITVIAIYITSLAEVSRMRTPLFSLWGASHVVFRLSRMRLYGLLAIVSPTPADKAAFQVKLLEQVEKTADDYRLLMYGGSKHVTPPGHDFHFELPAATFASHDTSDIFHLYQDAPCHRKHGPCAAAGSEYHAATSAGLDRMIWRMLDEMRLLAVDDVSHLTTGNVRYQAMHEVGSKDLHGGLHTALAAFAHYADSRYNHVVLLHTILLVVTVLLALLYAFFLLRPYARQVASERRKVAGLLSHVPTEMDVQGHVKQVLGTSSLELGDD